MKFVDHQTFIFFFLVLCIIILHIFIIQWNSLKERFSGIGWWLASYIVRFIGLLCFFSSNPWISLLLGNLLACLGIILKLNGFEKFFKKPSFHKFNYGLLLIWLVVQLYFLFIQPDLRYRILNYSIFNIILFSEYAHFFFYRVDEKFRPLVKWLGWIFVGCVVVFVYRIIGNLLYTTTEQDILLYKNPHESIFLILFLLFFSQMVFFTLILLNQIIHFDLRQEIQERQKVEQSLQESTNYYHVLFELAGDGTFLSDSKGRLIDVNQNACDYLGYTKQELLQLSLFDITQNTPEELESIIVQLQKNDTYLFESIHYHKTGYPIPVEIQVNRFKRNGQEFGLSLSRNITKRKESEKQMQLISTALENTANGVVITDIRGTIQWTNQAFFQITGYSIEEVIGKNLNILKSNLVKPELYKDLWLTILSGKVWRHIFINKKKNGELYFDEQTITPIKNENNEITHFISIRFDVSQRKQMEEALLLSQNRLKNLMDNLLTGVVQVDPNGIIVYANNAASEILGIHFDVITQKYYSDTNWNQIDIDGNPYPLDKLPLAIALQKKLPVINTEHGIKSPTNEIKWLLVNATPILDSENKVQGAIANFIDITNRHEIEKNLKVSKEMLESAYKSKSEFLANMSHEIRTPMNVIIGFTKILRERYSTDKPALEYIEGIETSGKNLIYLLNDILDMAKLESNRLEIKYSLTNIYTFIHEIEIMFAALIKQKKLLFALNIDETIPKNLMIDKLRLRQILFNLIGNAIKFTNQGGIVVNIVKKQKEQDLDNIDLDIEIIDTGMGINEMDLQNIFEPFKQQTGQSSKFGGSGLGLSITKRLIELMSGSITVDSDLNQGSKFVVSLKNVQTILVNKTSLEQPDLSSLVMNSSSLQFDYANTQTRIQQKKFFYETVEELWNNKQLELEFISEFEEWYKKSQNNRKFMNVNGVKQDIKDLQTIGNKFNLNFVIDFCSNMFQALETFSFRVITENMKEIELVHDFITKR